MTLSPLSLPALNPRVSRTALALAMVNERMKLGRAHLDVFIEMICKDDHGDALVLAPLHRQWVRHVEYCWRRSLRALIMAPFGSGKTSTLAVPLIAHAIGNDRNIRIKVVANDDPGASKRVMAVKRILEDPAYHQVFSQQAIRKGDKWNDHELYIQRSGNAVDPTLHARGVFTSGIGGRCDFILFDDVVDQKNAMDPAQRKKVLDLVEQTWMSRLEPDGRSLMIGTAWHQGDAAHVLMQRQGWCSLIQRVAEDCSCIEQEVYGADDGMYPTMG